MEGTEGLMKLVNENTTQKLDQYDYHKKYDGYANRYVALESRMNSLEKQRERKWIQYELFSGFFAGLGEAKELPVEVRTEIWSWKRSASDVSGRFFRVEIEYTVYGNLRRIEV